MTIFLCDSADGSRPVALNHRATEEFTEVIAIEVPQDGSFGGGVAALSRDARMDDRMDALFSGLSTGRIIAFGKVFSTPLTKWVSPRRKPGPISADFAEFATCRRSSVQSAPPVFMDTGFRRYDKWRLGSSDHAGRFGLRLRFSVNLCGSVPVWFKATAPLWPRG
jgi:hypothetical protein